VIALLIAAAVAAAASLFGTRFIMLFLTRIGRGQPILGRDERGPEHQHKEGTPTMGGVAILGAAFVGYVVAHVRTVYFSDQVLVMLGGVLAMALVGFVDDFIKVRMARNRGIFWKRKNFIVLGVAFLISLTLWWAVPLNTRLSFTRFDWPGWQIGGLAYVLVCTVVIFATTHAVNVTDGLDGLAAGSAIFGFFAFTIIAFWGFRNPAIYLAGGGIVNPLDLAVLAVSLAAASVGFLWWNAAPARIIMGDVGALGLGTALALLAITTNTLLLLPIICGLNVVEILSVAAQMTSYKYFGRRRIFLMSPIHHHFELVGWPETTVVVRFWLISGTFVAVALGIYYADYARVVGV
jgi:phospho-N-acetylmuramoyl-pentapeptide-transferase